MADKINKVVATVATPGQAPDPQEISYRDTKVIGRGSFGVVYQAKLCHNDEMVAIKKVLQNDVFNNQELHIMRHLEHCNIVTLKYIFFSEGDEKKLYLNIVMEYIPKTLFGVAMDFNKSNQTMPICLVKVFIYQVMRGLGYVHSLGVAHRDVKPENLLVYPESGVLKLCDFGSAKYLKDTPNTSYVCSRYYRAPELLLGSIDYTTKIDVWSAGCVLAELLLGQPIFPGVSGADQLVKIINVLGMPTREQIKEMNPRYTEIRTPYIKSQPIQNMLEATPEAIEFILCLLEYAPTLRISPLQACAHSFFDELRDQKTRLPDGRPLPPLFNFTEQELSIEPSLNKVLIPRWSSTVHSTPEGASSSTTNSSSAQQERPS